VEEVEESAAGANGTGGYCDLIYGRTKAPEEIAMYDRLLAHLAKHFSRDYTANWDQWGYMHHQGSEPNALLYVPLFCPKFVEVDGSVLLDGPIRAADCEDLAESFRQAKAASKSLADAERGFTWLELPYLFSDRSGDDEDNILLCEFVAEIWRARLHYLYHPRKFEVSVEIPDDDDAHVSFREIR
jgi:hypothetical protein